MSFSKLAVWWHSLKTRRKMDRVFSRGEDPYKYDSSPYEKARLASMENALGGRRYKSALEVGCAEGRFTRRLAAACEKVTAVDVSSVALARAKAAAPGAVLVETDIREWTPGEEFDLIVLGDVLYYLDKPMVRQVFEAMFPKIASWLAPGGRLVLAHGFAGEQELDHRRSFRERFEAAGLKPLFEDVVGKDATEGPVFCLLSVMEKE